MNRICHLTSAHSRFDTRIFLKECRSLANYGYAVTLIVADGKGEDTRDGVSILDAGVSKGRIDRIKNITARILKMAIEAQANVYHLHDPELIPAGLKLKRLGKKVIFDAHEDLPKQLLTKPYLNKPARILSSKLLAIYEKWACSKFDAVVAATPVISDKFSKINGLTLDVNNFPMLGELASDEVCWERKKNHVCYVGNITRIRGINEVLTAFSALNTDVRLQLIGEFSDASLAQAASANPGWRNVDALGFLGRAKVKDVLSQSVAGLVTFLPSPNHTDAQPNKMFEYMSAGLPVIASNFPLWKEIIEGNSCGLCVDPLDPRAIADAIDYLVAHPAEAEKMGRNGQLAVQNRYNWRFEETKLYNFYERVLNA